MSRPSFSAPTIASSLVLAALVSVHPAAASLGTVHHHAAQADAQQQQPVADEFRQVLERYGTFQTHARYGEVWIPSQSVAPPGWRPYPVCHWVYQREEQTWYFNDQTEWGNIVHHYGRWANDPSLGWIWVADVEHGPGWVHWHHDTRTVSWAAMLPPQDADQQPSADAWQSQDVTSFNTSCRQQQQHPVAALPQPPAPVLPRVPAVIAPRHPPLAIARPPALPRPIVVVRPPITVRPPIGGPVLGPVRPRIVTGWVRPPITAHLHMRGPVRNPVVIRPPIRVRPPVVVGLRPPMLRPAMVRPPIRLARPPMVRPPMVAGLRPPMVRSPMVRRLVVRPPVYRPPVIRTARIARTPVFRAPVNRLVFRAPVRVNRPVFRAPIARIAPRVNFAPRIMSRPTFSAPRRYVGWRR